MTSTVVPTRRAGVQTDSCFVIDRRGRTPVRIGGGYHILPKPSAPWSAAPESEEACCPPGDETTPNLGYMLPPGPEGFSTVKIEQVREMQRENDALPVHTANGQVYGEHMPDTDRYAHGAASVASDIERFLVGTYGNAATNEQPSQRPVGTAAVSGGTSSGKAAATGGIGGALLAMYRVMRPSDRIAHGAATTATTSQLPQLGAAMIGSPRAPTGSPSRRPRSAHNPPVKPSAGTSDPQPEPAREASENAQKSKMSSLDGSTWGWASTLRE